MEIKIHLNKKYIQKKIHKKTIVVLMGVLFTIILVSSIIGIIYRKNDGDVSFTFEDGEYLIEEKMLAPWWDSNYRYYKRIILENTDSENPIIEKQWVTFEINHKKLVEKSYSLEDASEIRVVYLNDSRYEELPFIIEGSNTESANISFQVFQNIDPKTRNRNYFLYYGNKYPETSEVSIDEYNPESTPKSFRITLSSQARNPVFLSQNRLWILKGTNNFEDYSKIKLRLDISSSIDLKENPKYRVNGTLVEGEFEKTEENVFEAEIDPNSTLSGEYSIDTWVKLKDGTLMYSPKEKIIISYPLYIVWSMDWEGYDTSDETLKAIDEFSKKYETPISHFWNPRVNLVLSKERVKYLIDWIKTRAEKQGDEIGLHLHMHYDMVEASGVEEILTTPHWASDRGNGSDVPTSSYPIEDFEKMLVWALAEFKSDGLPTPKSYRAGGWFADLEMLQVLPKYGFVLDSSGRTKYSLGSDILPDDTKESEANQNETEYFFSEEELLDPISAPITEDTNILYQTEYKVDGFWDLLSTTRPYKISEIDQNSYISPNIELWEFPNNGADSWHFGTQDMIERFKDNYENKPLNQSQVVTYLSHPHSVQVDISRLEGVYEYISKNLAKDDTGPVVFVTLVDAYEDFEEFN